MKTEYLKYLIAISKERTMADAAEKLFLTPQALSMAIKKLEQELNMKLLYRFPNGVILSENGEWLVGLASKFFYEIEERQRLHQDYTAYKDIEPKGHELLAVNNLGICSSRLVDVVCDLSQQYPEFDVELIERPRCTVENMVLNEDVDFGFVFRTKYNGKFIDKLPDELSFHPLQSGELIIQAAAHLNLSKNDSVLLRKIAKQKFCSYGADDSTNNTGQLLDLLNCKDTVYNLFSSYSQYVSNILSGKYLGISVALDDPTSCANYIDGAKNIRLQDDIVVFFGIIRKKDKPYSDNMKFIFNKILQAYNLTMDELTADL